MLSSSQAVRFVSCAGNAWVQREIEYLGIDPDHFQYLLTMRTGDQLFALIPAVKVDDLAAGRTFERILHYSCPFLQVIL